MTDDSSWCDRDTKVSGADSPPQGLSYFGGSSPTKANTADADLGFTPSFMDGGAAPRKRRTIAKGVSLRPFESHRDYVWACFAFDLMCFCIVCRDEGLLSMPPHARPLSS